MALAGVAARKVKVEAVVSFDVSLRLALDSGWLELDSRGETAPGPMGERMNAPE